MVFRIQLAFLRFGVLWLFFDLDLFWFSGYQVIVLTIQRLKGFESPHNLFDKRIDFLDFWKPRNGNIY